MHHANQLRLDLHWIFIASCGLCYVSYIIYMGPKLHLGVTVTNVVKAKKEASQLPLCDKEV